jgi:hypothetical protein
MIPTFRRAVKCQYHVYRHTGIDHILYSCRAPDLERGAIVKIARDTGIQETALRDWDRHRVADENRFPFAEAHPRARALGQEYWASI